VQGIVKIGARRNYGEGNWTEIFSWGEVEPALTDRRSFGWNEKKPRFVIARRPK